MADFFREVDEDVRRDQLVQFWKRYQNWIIGGAILIVVATGTWRVYEYFRIRAAEAAGARYFTAAKLVIDGNNPEAAKDFDAIAASGPRGYALLARLSAANVLAIKDPKTAVSVYNDIAADPSIDPAYQNIARLRGAYLRVDMDDPKEFEQLYGAYAGPDSPYRNAYRELMALADLKRGDYDAAARWLELAAADPASPPALRARADAFLTLVQAGPVPAK